MISHNSNLISSKRFSYPHRDRLHDISLVWNEGVSKEAKQLLKESVVIDGCALGPADYEDWQLDASGLSAACFSVLPERADMSRAVTALIDCRSAIRNNPKMQAVYSAEDILAAHENGKVGVITAAHCVDYTHHHEIKTSVRVFGKAGIRVMALSSPQRSFGADGCFSGTNSGLSQDGPTLIVGIEEAGITLDLSGVAERSALQAMERCKKPPVYSHANPRSLFDHPFNITDQEALKCAELGGVVAATAYLPTLWDGTNRPTADSFVDAVCYWINLLGHEHVALGLDCAGSAAAYPRIAKERLEATLKNAPQDMRLAMASLSDDDAAYITKGIESFANLPLIVHKLLERGLSAEAVKGVLGGNLLRVFRETWR